MTELSKGKIPYLGQFAKKPDFEQKSLLQDLRMKDVLCTRSNWINQGRDPSTMDEYWYAYGEGKCITIEGIPLGDPLRKAGYVIERAQKFQPYLLEPSNMVMGTIMARAFEPFAPPAAQMILFWVLELQRSEVTLQNKINDGLLIN